MADHQHKLFPTIALVSEDATLAAALRIALEHCFGNSSLRKPASREATLTTTDLVRVDLVMIDAAGLSAPQIENRVLDARAALDRLSSEAPVVVLGDPANAEWVATAIESGATDAIDRSSITPDRLGLIVERAMACAEVDVRRVMLIRELKATNSQLKSHCAALEQRIAKLEAEAWTDPLTGLANRWQLENRLGQMFAEAVRYGTDLACVMIDLDGFKEVNDSAGHAAGDEILRLVGHVISDCIRQSDFAARYGGDEFVIIMPQTSSEVAMAVAQRLQAKFRAQAEAWGIECKHDCAHHDCGMSLGVASLRQSKPIDADQLLINADRALYAAKKAGRGQARVFEPRPIDENESARHTD
ncbi:MAG: diguanylate cyclase [Phycisphaerales bacterium JB050]